VGGKSNAPQGTLRCIRSTPSLPEVQKNSFSGVIAGSGRRTAAIAFVPASRAGDRYSAPVDMKTPSLARDDPSD
jgi:hypothetical protein